MGMPHRTPAKSTLCLAIAVAGVVLCGLSFAYRSSTLPADPAPDPTPEASPIPQIIPEAATPAGSASYVEVVDSCGTNFGGNPCVNVRLDPSAQVPSILKLRTGVVLPVAHETVTDADGRVWYRIQFSEWVRYPERVAINWYVAADVVKPLYGHKIEDLGHFTGPATIKRIVIDQSEQKLYAYDGDELFMETAVSTGLDLTPTQTGTFTVYRKMPSRYMQGPLPGVSDEYYDLPGVPWNLYFTPDGGAIHGTYWHADFGHRHSHGCVNLPSDLARELYEWAPLGTTVIVRD